MAVSAASLALAVPAGSIRPGRAAHGWWWWCSDTEAAWPSTRLDHWLTKVLRLFNPTGW